MFDAYILDPISPFFITQGRIGLTPINPYRPKVRPRAKCCPQQGEKRVLSPLGLEKLNHGINPRRRVDPKSLQRLIKERLKQHSPEC